MTSGATSGTRTSDGLPGGSYAGRPAGGDGLGGHDGHDGHGGGAGGSPHGKEYTVIVALRERQGRREFLMVRHRERGWELPGGKLEAREGPVHCALREFREETGHLLGEPKFVAKLQKANGLCYVFTGRLGTRVAEEDADPGEDEAVQGMEWFERLPRGPELAFPDDPYEEMGRLLGIDFG